MTRVFKKIGNFALFHDLPGVHQRHPIGILTHQRQIVCNQQQGYTVLFLQFLEQIQNLRLTRYVKRRRGFISHHDIGTTSQRHGDHDTLLLAPRKFVRKRIKTLLRLVQASHCSALCLASSLLTRSCNRTASTICSPTVITGLRLVAGS